MEYIFVVTLIHLMNVPYETDVILSEEQWAFTTPELAEAFSAAKQRGIAPENRWGGLPSGDSYFSYKDEKHGDTYVWECFIRKIQLNPSA